jgi:NAD(P)H-hydrate epimerase
MIPLFSSQQIRNADRFAIEQLKIPGIILMENAARSILNCIKKRFELQNKNICIICGKGNNGGDGLALARHLLFEGADINVLLLSSYENLSLDAKVNYNIFSSLVKYYPKSKIILFGERKSLSFLSKADIIVDAIFGTGITGDISEPYKTVISTANKINCKKISVDIPSGLNADTGYTNFAFKADLTVTLAELKKGLFVNDGKYYSGEIEKGTIGIGDEYFSQLAVNEYLIEPEDVIAGIPKRKINANKYSAGKVLVIAGSKHFTGAPVLTAKSALKSGGGAVVIACPESIRTILQKKITEPTILPYNDGGMGILCSASLNEIKPKIKWADSIVIGPGLGRDEETLKTVWEIIHLSSTKKIIIDADAIYALREKIHALPNIVFTPHYKEFADLIGLSMEDFKKDILAHGREFAKSTKAFLVLKGAPTLIFNPKGKVFVNTTGNPGMAKFGVGDVLSGILGSFISTSDNIEQSIISAVYLHSLSADLLKIKKQELTYTATDIIENLHNAIKFVSNSLL